VIVPNHGTDYRDADCGATIAREKGIGGKHDRHTETAAEGMPIRAIHSRSSLREGRY
jgi:hypothetical protein